MDVIGPIVTVAGIAVVFLLGLHALLSDFRRKFMPRRLHPPQRSEVRPLTFSIMLPVRLVAAVAAMMLGIGRLLFWYGRRW